MSTKRWAGGAPATAQLNTITVGGSAATSQVYSIVIGNQTVSYTALVSDTNTTIATALQLLLVASTIPQFLEVTWTNPSAGVIVGTANTPGYPFTNTSSATGTGTLVTVITTACTGPNHFSNAANWFGNAVPVSTDDIVFDFGAIPLRYDISQAAIIPNSLTFWMSYQSPDGIGLPAVNVFGASAYPEYRPTYLALGGCTTVIGVGVGSG